MLPAEVHHQGQLAVVNWVTKGETPPVRHTIIYLTDGADHMWGEGQSLAGAVLNPQNMPHHGRSPAQLAGDSNATFHVGECWHSHV